VVLKEEEGRREVTKSSSAKRFPVSYAFSLVGGSAQTTVQHPTRLKKFFDFIEIPPIVVSINGEKTTKKKGMTYEEMKKQTAERKKKLMEVLDEQGQNFLQQAKQEGHEWVTHNLMLYLNHHKQRVLRGELSSGTLKNMYRPIKDFLDTYPEVSAYVPWKRITRTLPRVKLYANDRAPTVEELRKAVGFMDYRIKPIIYVMASSGIRVGAWDSLKWKHVRPIKSAEYLTWKKHQEIREKGHSDIVIKKEEDGEDKIVAASLLVYADTAEQYTTFMTPEAYFALKDYMDFRARYGEKITGQSWLIRDVFPVVDAKKPTSEEITKRKERKKNRKNSYDFGGASSGGEHYGYQVKNGDVTKPLQFSSDAIKHIILRALYVTGVRSELQEGSNRHEFKGAHGLRKFFDTRASYAGVPRGAVELLMGHNLGVTSSYLRLSEYELLSDYLRAVPALTINEDIASLKRQQEILEQKQEKELLKIKQDYQAANELVVKAVNQTQEMVNRYKAQQAEMANLQETIKRLEKEMKELEEEKRKN
jgi:hypothetical protein